MRILIIDDVAIKAHWSEKQIKANYKDAIFEFASYGKAGIDMLEEEQRLEDASKHYDFVVLDMQFSFTESEAIDDACCLRVLKAIQDSSYIDHNIPVCICSSGGRWIRELDNYDNVVGFVRYEVDDGDSPLVFKLNAKK